MRIKITSKLTSTQSRRLMRASARYCASHHPPRKDCFVHVGPGLYAPLSESETCDDPLFDETPAQHIRAVAQHMMMVCGRTFEFSTPDLP